MPILLQPVVSRRVRRWFMTPVHITKRALAHAGGRDSGAEPPNVVACTGANAFDLPQYCSVGFNNYHLKTKSVTCPDCLVLLDAELEGRSEAGR